MFLRNHGMTTLAGMVMLLLVALLYGPFADNPTFFDDVYFFIDPKGYLAGLSWANPWAHVLDVRWIARASMAFTFEYWGASHRAYRVGNLLMHAATAFSLFLLLRELLAGENKAQTAQDARRTAALPAFAAALLFALHPVAAFAVGYIIERSIVLAGFFSLWMWIAVQRGVAQRSQPWLLTSVVCYFLAVFSKEHAVTALPVAVLIGWNAAHGDWRKSLGALKWALPMWLIVAVLIVLRMKGVIGTAYEPLLAEMGEVKPQAGDDHLLRSMLNQGGLFFKYALFWLIPNENWMAIDLRPPFPPSGLAWPWLFGFLAFIGYSLLLLLALWRAWLPRLVGIGLLAPWLLFLTAFGAVLYQEPFVLYRSYLWALPGMLPVAVLLSRLPQRGQILALTVVGLVCFGSTWSRLQTFSHPLLIWEEAVVRLQGRDDLPGAHRIYFNRGIVHTNLGGPNLLMALQDFNKSMALNPGYAPAYHNRGAAYAELGEHAKALADFEHTLALKPDYLRAHLGRGLALLQLGRSMDGLAELAYACDRGMGCKQYAEEFERLKNSGGLIMPPATPD